MVLTGEPEVIAESGGNRVEGKDPTRSAILGITGGPPGSRSRHFGFTSPVSSR